MELQIIFSDILFILLGYDTASLGNQFIKFLDQYSISQLLEWITQWWGITPQKKYDLRYTIAKAYKLVIVGYLQSNKAPKSNKSFLRNVVDLLPA